MAVILKTLWWTHANVLVISDITVTFSKSCYQESNQLNHGIFNVTCRRSSTLEDSQTPTSIPKTIIFSIQNLILINYQNLTGTFASKKMTSKKHLLQQTFYKMNVVQNEKPRWKAQKIKIMKTGILISIQMFSVL